MLQTASGTPKQLGKPFVTVGRCGYDIKRVSIAADGLITVAGNKAGTSCADQGGGAPYTATFRVKNGAVQTIQPMPQDGQ